MLTGGKMNIIFIAPPAAGKGTISDLLKEKYGFTHISAGDVLREQVNIGSEIGKEVKEIMNRGEMVNDDLMKRLIETKLKSIDLKIPFMLDGYPRKMNQREDYENILNSLGLNVDKVLFINIDKETGLKRILGRISCPKCKKNYNNLTGYAKPKEENFCDDCHIELIARNDDTKEAYEKRYDIYMTETAPVIEYYKQNGKLVEIDGTKSPEETLEVVENILGVKND